MTATDYLRRVDGALGDLPWRMRRELLAELRDHLAELPAETDLGERLGTPEQYAADLRAAAGLERRRGPIAFIRARRPRNVVLTLLALIVIGLAIGAVVWVDSYQPLAFGDTYQFPHAAKGTAGLDGESVIFRKGRPFQLGMNVFNNGRFTVRVLGVPLWSWFPFSGTVWASKPAKYTGGAQPPFAPFHPVDLKPGDSIYLFLKGRFACHTGTGVRTSLTFDEFPVRFSFLWRTTTAYVPFPGQLAIVFPKGCPPVRGTPATP